MHSSRNKNVKCLSKYLYIYISKDKINTKYTLLIILGIMIDNHESNDNKIEDSEYSKFSQAMKVC